MIEQSARHRLYGKSPKGERQAFKKLPKCHNAVGWLNSLKPFLIVYNGLAMC